MDAPRIGRRLQGVALVAAALAASGPASAAARFFGRYTGQATVTTSPFYPPGVYDAEVAIAQTAAGIVGYVNITFDAADFLSGIVTHTFAAPIDTAGTLLFPRYSDRLCGGGDPPDKCYPHAPTSTQYSFQGPALFLGTKLTLGAPQTLPGLPYAATRPFDQVALSRAPDAPRTSFEGNYPELQYVWMGTIFVTLPLPLLGSNHVRVEDGEVTFWVGNSGAPVAIPGVISASCFDDAARLGWMNQQGKWAYRWILDAQGRGLGVIVTFTFGAPPDCADLQDPLAGGLLDLTHKNLIGFMYEPAPAVVGPGAVGGLRVGRDGAAGTIELDWGGDCGTGTAYAVYRGDLAAGYASIAPEPGACDVGGHHATLPAGSGTADFFLVVPHAGGVEGSYGIDGQGTRRPPAAAPCYPPGAVDSCAP